MLKKTLLSTAMAAFCFSAASSALANDKIRAVGSSTVYPFVTTAAEEFGKRNDEFNTPIIESTGTGGGFKLFCSGVGEGTPDLANASRAIKSSEVELCKKNGVNNVIEVKLGSDGIVLANSVYADGGAFTTQHIFLALARKVPVNGKLVDNPYTNWNEIDKSLPNKAIEVYGPPPTSGTRDAFVEIVMEAGCDSFAEFKAAYPNDKERHKTCHLLREDGVFIEAGENDNLIVQKLNANPDAFGIFGFSFLEQNGELVQGALINNIEPTFETIADGSYAVSRPLFVYVKGDHSDKTPGLKAFIEEMLSERASGQDGYLVYKGLVPLPEANHIKQREDVLNQL